MIEDPRIWVSISFLTFLALTARPLGRMIAGQLDARAAKIRAELETATQLRKEAEKLLAEYQQKQRDMLREAETILATARIEADHMAESAEAQLKATIDARLRQAEEKIARAEADAVRDVRAHVVDVAVAAARTVLTQKIAASGADPLVEQSLKDIGKKLH